MPCVDREEKEADQLADEAARAVGRCVRQQTDVLLEHRLALPIPDAQVEARELGELLIVRLKSVAEPCRYASIQRWISSGPPAVQAVHDPIRQSITERSLRQPLQLRAPRGVSDVG